MSGGLDAYLPIDRRQAIVAGASLPDRTSGAALFADVSGFTALTGALEAELGRKRGAEELLRHINRVYEHLVAQVHSRTGSVVGFAGDSITCWFDDRPGGAAAPSTAAHRALSAAHAMQEGMNTVAVAETPSGARVSLGIKVAITAGPARRFAVGDPSRFLMDTLAGRTLDRMAAAERLAAVHEIVVGPEVVAAIGDPLEVRAWRPAAEPGQEGFAVVGALRAEAPATPWPALAEGAWTETLARPWIIPAVYERLRIGGAFLGELRPAVPMFVGFQGIDYDAEDRAGALLDAYVRWAQDTLARYEGSIIQLTIGDKGSNLYATFGAPIAHEDDVERAFSAALDLHTPPRDLDFVGPVRIGVSQGQVWTGACGSHTRRCYGVMGHPVNLAARLMGRAGPGQTLVEERLSRSVATRFESRSEGDLALKGRKDPVPTAAVTGRRTAPAADRLAPAGTELVGRDRELAALTALLAPVVAGERRLVLIEGEAGIGKSRLVAALADRARGAGLPTLVGGADSVERSRAYHAWRGVFTGLFELDGAPDQDAARDRVLARIDALDPALARRASLLNAVLPVQFPDDPFVLQMDGAVRAQNTRDLLGRLLAELTGGPLVLVLEDAHWFDSASWALLGALRRRSEPVLLVLVSRPVDALGGADALPAEFREFAESPGTLRIRLDALAAADAVALAGRRLGVDELPPALARLIGERAEGNPFFIEEMVRALGEAGLLEIVNGHCVMRPASPQGATAFPDTLEGLITSRLDRLDPVDQRTAKVASVIGRIFPYRTLEAVFPIAEERPRLRGSLDQLERLDITPRHAPEPDLAYIFKHAIMQEVVYGSLLFAQRQELHRAVAEWFEAAYQPDLEPFYPLLAHHWESAQAPVQALAYFERAGEQSHRSFANREAVGFFTKALAALAAEPPTPDAAAVRGHRLRRIRALRRLGQAEMALGDTAESTVHIRNAMVLLGHPEPVGVPRLLASLLGAMVRQSLHRLAPRLVLRRAPPNSAERVELAHLWFGIMQAYYYTGNVPGALIANFRSLNLAESAMAGAELAPEVARGLGNVGAIIRSALGLREMAARYFERARATARSVGHLPSLAYLDKIESMIFISSGDLHLAHPTLERSLALHEELGDKRGWEETHFVRANWHFLRGDMAPILGLVEASLESGRRREDLQSEVLSLCQRGQVLIVLNRLDAAIADLERSRWLRGEGGLEGERICSTGLLALARARRGEVPAAAAALDEVVELVSRVPANFVAIDGYAGAAEAALLLMESGAVPREQGMRWAGAALTQLGTVVRRLAPVHRSRLLTLEARRDSLLGRRRSAVRGFRRALATAAARGMRYDEARAAAELAILTAPGPARQEYAARAGALLQQIGADWDLARLSGSLTSS